MFSHQSCTCVYYEQIAEALDFLAQQSYIHRDVAARNCLGMQLCDFYG